MEADLGGSDGACTEDVDPLDLMAGVAAESAAIPTKKRTLPPLSGRDVCFVAGCDCRVGLKGIPKERAADAQHISVTHASHSRHSSLRASRISVFQLHRRDSPKSNLPV
jgi:hypothetical protein